MRPDIVPALAKMPGVLRFVDDLWDGIQQGHSGIVVTNSAMQAGGLWHVLDHRRGASELDIVSLDAAEMKGASPCQALAGSLSIALPPAGRDRVAWLLQCGQLPEVMLVHGLDSLPEEERQAWLGLFVDWSKAASQSSSRLDPLRRLWGIVVLRQGDVLPDPDVWLDIHWWPPRLSLLEMHLLCRTENDESALGLWRESVLPALAGTDVELLEALWDVVDKEIDVIWARLFSVARQRQWTQERLAKWGALELLQKPHFIPFGAVGDVDMANKHRALWAERIIVESPEYGGQVSSAALAVLGRRDIVHFRLWRGQVAQILPALEALRLEICQALTSHWGRDWPLRWRESPAEDKRANIKDNPMMTGWGHLQILLSDVEDLAEMKYLWPMVARARSMRNRLAHCLPASYADYVSILQAPLAVKN